MKSSAVRRFVATAVATAAFTVGTGAGVAQAQTREHVLLARTLPAVDSSVEMSFSAQNPSPTAQNSSAVVSLGKLGRVE